MMMKRVCRIVLVGLLISILPLFGSLYRSNSLGQELQLLDADAERSAHRYILQVSTNDTVEERVLYDSDNEIMRTVIVSDPFELGKRTVTETSYTQSGDLHHVEKSYFEHGLPKRVEVTNNGDEQKYLILYSYEDGQLVEKKDLVDGEMIRLTTYYRGEEGTLNGLRIIELQDEARTAYFTRDGDATVFGEMEDGKFTRITFHPGNLVVRDVYSGKEVLIQTTVSYDSAGRLVVDEEIGGENTRKIYGPDGMLAQLETIEADGAKRTINYIYDASGVLDQSVEQIVGEQSIRIASWYRDGVVQTQTEWLNDMPVKATRFVEDGTSVVTLFENGRPYVDVTYAPDGKRVLSLEYRKER